MCCHLAFIESFVLFPRAFDPQRPVTQVPRVLNQESVVAAVRRQTHCQKLKVLSPKPGYLLASRELKQTHTHIAVVVVVVFIEDGSLLHSDLSHSTQQQPPTQLFPINNNIYVLD